MTPTENRLCVKATITGDDVRRFLFYHNLHEPSLRILHWGLYFVWIDGMTYKMVSNVYGLTAGDPLHGILPLMAAAISIPITALSGVLFFHWTIRSQAARWTRDTIGVTGERTVEISPEGVSSKWDAGESTQKWTAFYRIIGTPEFLCFYQGRHFATIIPRRAFDSRKESEAFLQAAKEWHAAAIGRTSS